MQHFRFTTALLVCAWLILACQSAQAQYPAGPAAVHAEEMRRGVAALDAGDAQTAYDIFSGLLREYPTDDDLNFRLGTAAYATKRYPHALLAYQRILARHPEADRVRLEAARTYVAMEQYNQARQEFQTVLSHNPPEAVRTNIELALSELDNRQRTWSFSPFVSVGAFYDSNVNTGPNAAQYNLPLFTAGPLIITPESQSKSDWGRFGSVGARIDHLLDSEGKWLLTGNGMFYQRWNDVHEQSDLTYARADIGVQHIFGNDSVAGLSTKYENIQYGYDQLADIYGLTPTYMYPVTSWMQLITTGNVERREYQVSDQKSDYWSVGEDLRILIGQKNHELVFGGNIFAEDARSTRFSNDGWELGIKPTVKLPWETDLYLRTILRQTEYHSPAIGYEDRRSDTLERHLVGLRRFIWLPGLSADLNVEYSKNNSNSNLYDYERTVVTFGLTYAP